MQEKYYQDFKLFCQKICLSQYSLKRIFWKDFLMLEVFRSTILLLFEVLMGRGGEPHVGCRLKFH